MEKEMYFSVQFMTQRKNHVFAVPITPVLLHTQASAKEQGETIFLVEALFRILLIQVGLWSQSHQF
jgi:hypothetical protein